MIVAVGILSPVFRKDTEASKKLHVKVGVFEIFHTNVRKSSRKDV